MFNNYTPNMKHIITELLFHGPVSHVGMNASKGTVLGCTKNALSGRKNLQLHERETSNRRVDEPRNSDIIFPGHISGSYAAVFRMMLTSRCQREGRRKMFDPCSGYVHTVSARPLIFADRTSAISEVTYYP